MKISVNTQREIAYDLHFSDNLFSLENKLLLTGRNERSRNCFIVVDKNVYANFGSQIENYFQNRTESFHILQLEAEEDSKNIKNFIKISEELNKYPIKRRCEPIIIIGGGVIGDLASFAASCLRRGIPHIKVPTTVMAYVDASVGIKTGINFGAYKNRLGSFSEPISVLFDKTLFSTLPKRDIANGIGEIIKLAVIKNIDLFYSLEEKIDTIFQTNFQDPSCQNILETSIIDMVEELEPNLFEKNLKRSVDFGHTFSLALEMDPENDIKHGEAVALDILFSCFLSYERKLLSYKDLIRIIKLTHSAHLPIDLSIFDTKTMWNSVLERMDHRDGMQNIPIPNGIGKCIFINDLTQIDLMNALKSYHNIFLQQKLPASVD